MKIRPVADELFHADGQTDITKLVAAFRRFTTAPKKDEDKKKRGKSVRVIALSLRILMSYIYIYIYIYIWSTNS